MKKVQFALLITIIFFLQGCGTIILDKHAPIVISGKEEDKTQYFIYDKKNQMVASGYAPDKIKFKSSYGSSQDAEYKVVLQPLNRKSEVYSIERGISGWPFVSFSLIPLDLITDSFRVFPEVELETQN